MFRLPSNASPIGSRALSPIRVSVVPAMPTARRTEIAGRRVRCPRDMVAWERSEALADVVAFVDRMNALSAAAASGPRPAAAADVLRRVGEWAAEAPCFDDFHATLRARGPALLCRAYGRDGDHRVAELPAYLETSFGDPATVTYGPQHELSFAMFLIALFKLGRLTYRDEPYVVSALFDRYLDVVDHLIRSFNLGPEHGGGVNADLDGYRYLGFVWGSAQRTGRGDGRATTMFARCADAAQRREEDRAADEACPPRPLWRHSYGLRNAEPSRWDLVNRRLVAAYRRHVLRRFDVVRCLVFGQLLGYAPGPRRPAGASFYNGSRGPDATEATDGTDDGDDDDDDRDGGELAENYDYYDRCPSSFGTESHEAIEEFQL